MVVLESQAAVNSVKNLPFCYLCGLKFDGHSEWNRDHVPPNAIFASKDRDFPLLLPTHARCNKNRSDEDAKIGNLFRVMRGESYSPHRGRLELHIPVSYPQTNAVTNFDLQAVIRRWIRGFHAALYRQFLPDEKNFSTMPPLVRATADGSQLQDLPEVYPLFIELIKRNRSTKSLDRIQIRNKTCTYECVWTKFDNEDWWCVYALDIYNWINVLPSELESQRRGCVGAYRCPDGKRPLSGTETTNLDFHFLNSDPVDPFGT